jgi:predicted  nucleic acid-binding Zn-ribbon protein
MNEISKQNIETLVKLQEAESEIVRLKAVLEKIEKEKGELGIRLKQFGNALEKHKESLLSTQAASRDIDREIKIVDERIVRSNEKLRMVKTNKEYQLLLREVDDNRKRKDTLETELLEFFDEIEEMEEIVQDSEKEYNLLRDKIEAEQKDIDKKSTDDKELLDEYLARQNEIGKNLDASLMNQFMKISKMNKGLAVVSVENEVCMGCFMNIPAQLFIEVQRCNSLISCPQCSRIIYHINV